MSRGSIRRGEALLAGLLRCGHCGRKLHVAYSGENGSAGRYHCRGGQFNHGGDPCISFGGMLQLLQVMRQQNLGRAARRSRRHRLDARLAGHATLPGTRTA